MRQLVRKAIIALPFGKKFMKWYGQYRLNQMARSYGNANEFFSHIYETKLWGSPESASGPGSTLDYTAGLRQALPRLFAELKVRSMLDAPCGDYNWFRHVERDRSLTYIGADVVDALIQKNQELYGDEHTRFMVLDIRNDRLPAVDLWMCRDVLFHFSNEDIVRTIENFLASDIPYLLTSSHIECERNGDIPTGSFRQLNLEKAPFNFGMAARYIDDWVEGYPVRKMCLWHKNDLRDRLADNPYFAKARAKLRPDT